tara:strand:- start:34 stop:330 length:297 start_codon:yes stop_codon:yes gene_type:complete
MNLKKGDLILVSSLESAVVTCIIIVVFTDDQYFYCYCLEDGNYVLVYLNEIECILSEDFAPEFSVPSFFSVDYSFYTASFDTYSHFPSFPDDDDTEEI